MRLSRGSHSPFRALLFALFLVVFPIAQTAWAQSSAPSAAQFPPAWNDAVARLASKIAGLAGSRRTISISVKNISLLTDADVTGISQALKAELARLGFYPRDASSSDAQVVVTLSEGEEGYVWVVQVKREAAEETTMVSVRGPALGDAQTRKPAVSLQRRIIYTQPERFADFSVADIAADNIVRMSVLEPTRLASYHLVSGQWRIALAKQLHPAAFPPRDPRGMIWQRSSELDAYLPGEFCTSSAWSEEGDLPCFSGRSPSADLNWPLDAEGTQRGDADFQRNRNYFDGLATFYGQLQATLPAFFTAAVLSTQDDERWILTELDGNARLYDTSAKPSATFSGWGDDIATVVTGCAGDWQVLVTGTGDWTQPDHIQTFEIRDRQAAAVGQPLDFPGPILALWPSNDMRSARVVSRNLQTGMYEASIVSVTCSE